MKYTLDQIVGNQYVFLEHPNEGNQLHIPITEVSIRLVEGDIVTIDTKSTGYTIELLKGETESMRNKVESLLEKLQNKNR